MFTDEHDTDTAKFEMIKVQNSVRLKYEFYKAMLKVFTLERLQSVSKFGQQVYLRRREQQGWGGGSTPSHHHYFVMWLWLIFISQILIHSDVQMSRYFSKVTWPHRDDITSSWGGVSPALLTQELYLSNFGEHRPSRSEDNFNFTS